MNGTNGTNGGGFDLTSANDLLANAGRRDVISVEVQRVLTADAAEFGGARTVTEATRRHEITTKDRVGSFGVRVWNRPCPQG